MMKLKTLVFLTLMLGIVIFGGMITFKPTFAGFTTLSLSSADFRSSSSFWSGKTWILTVRQGGLSQHAEGIITKEEIKDKSGKEPEHDLKIDIDYGMQSCEYPISPNENALPIYKLNVITWGEGWNPLNKCYNPPSEEEAKRHCPHAIVYGKFAYSFVCFCIDAIPQSKTIAYKTIGSPYVRTKSRISVSNGEKTDHFDFDSKGKIEGYVGDNVYVIWDGYLSKDVCEDKDPYFAYYSGGKWHIGWASNYEEYREVWNDFIYEMHTNKPFGSKEPLEERVSRVNSYASKSLDVAYFGSIDNPTRISGAIIRKDMKSPVSIPVFTFYVKADWLGIIQPIPKPAILEVRSGKFKTDGSIYVKFKNIGNERGGFFVWAECPSPFSRKTQTKEATLNAGETYSLNLPISAEVSKPTSAYCTVYVSTVEKTVSKRVRVSADPEQECEPNKWYCENNKIYHCNEYGSVKEYVKTCGSNEICEYDQTGKAICVEKGSGNGGGGSGECAWYDIPCIVGKFISDLKERIKNFFEPLVIGVSILMTLISGIATSDIMRKRKILQKKSDNIYRKLSIATVMAVFGLLVYTYFWLGVLLIILYVIFQRMIPRITGRFAR